MAIRPNRNAPRTAAKHPVGGNTALIRKLALARGLDPAAVLAVASSEGLSGGIGDGGHAFGPFQLNNAGGVITGQNHGNVQQTNQWAWSRPGLIYALDRIASVARGRHGRDAVSNIVNRFERPAAPGPEIQRALGSYGKFKNGGGGSAGYQPAITGHPGPTPPGGSARNRPGSNPKNDNAFYDHLISRIIYDQPLNGTLSKPPRLTPPRPGKPSKPNDDGFYNNLIGNIIHDRPIAQGAERFNTLPVTKATPSLAVRRLPVASGSRVHATTLDQKPATGIAKTALTQLGNPYQYGGAAKLGGRTDCSGLLQASAAANGKTIGRTTYDQWKQGTAVPLNQLRAGDAVFFHMGPQGPSHVAIYVGNGKVVEDPHTGSTVHISALAGRGAIGARRY